MCQLLFSSYLLSYFEARAAAFAILTKKDDASKAGNPIPLLDLKGP